MNNKNLVWRTSLLFLGLTCCCTLSAQQQGDQKRAPREREVANYGGKESSDLAQDNLNHVAASAAQIRAVLVKDEGLLVELKRWVAKEATDNGQVVDDSSLTGQAIFERLDQDVVFRSVATRLLQRYGYLLPTSNPDSDLAKEKDVVLKERARRMVQIEAQEDSQSLQPQGNRQNLEQTAACNPRTEEDCPQQSPAGREQRTRSTGSAPLRQKNPQEVPDQLPLQRLPRLIQTDGFSQSPDLTDGLSSLSNLSLISDSGKPNISAFENSQPLGQRAIDASTLKQMLSSGNPDGNAAAETPRDARGTVQPSRPRITSEKNGSD